MGAGHQRNSRRSRPYGRGASLGSGAHSRPPIAALARGDEAEGRQRARPLAERHLDAAPGAAVTVRRVGEDADLELVDERLVGVGTRAHAHEPARRPRAGARDVQRVEGQGGGGRAGRRPAHARDRAHHDPDGAAVAVARIGDDPCAQGELVVVARLARAVADRVAQLPRRPRGRGRRDRDGRRRGGRARRSAGLGELCPRGGEGQRAGRRRREVDLQMCRVVVLAARGSRPDREAR